VCQRSGQGCGASFRAEKPSFGENRRNTGEGADRAGGIIEAALGLPGMTEGRVPRDVCNFRQVCLTGLRRAFILGGHCGERHGVPRFPAADRRGSAVRRRCFVGKRSVGLWAACLVALVCLGSQPLRAALPDKFVALLERAKSHEERAVGRGVRLLRPDPASDRDNRDVAKPTSSACAPRCRCAASATRASRPF
jgi:hypothetical protein